MANETRKQRREREAAEKSAQQAQFSASQENTMIGETDNVEDVVTENGDEQKVEGAAAGQAEAVVVKGEERPVLDPLTNRSWFTAETEAAVRAGLESGDIFAVPAVVNIRAKSSPTGKDEEQPYIGYYAETDAGEDILSAGKNGRQTDKPEKGDDNRSPFEKLLGARDYFNHGFFLKVYNNPIRAYLDELISGPEKQMLKTAKSMVDAKMEDSLEEAWAVVAAKRVSKGLPIAPFPKSAAKA